MYFCVLFLFLLVVLFGTAISEIISPQSQQQLKIIFITDLHIGEGCNHVLTYSACKPVRTLTQSIDKINALNKETPIDGVFVTGDLTSSALSEEFHKVRELLDTLDVLWWPLLGNHDSWTYWKYSDGTFNQTEYAYGDQLFTETFGDILKSRTEAWPGVSCTNLDTHYPSWFHNYEVSFPQFSSNFKILSLDWVARTDALPEPGVGPHAEIHDFECGTIDWLKQRLQTYSQKTKMFLAQHHPFNLNPTGFNHLKNFTFDSYQDGRIQEVLGMYFPASSYLGMQAGHIHRWFNGTAFTKWTAISNEWLELKQYETPACKGYYLDEEWTSSFQIFTFINNNDNIILENVEGLWKSPSGRWMKKPAHSNRV
jgi:3',5'-cyclic AMP phosphodiesterase CpdA